MRILACRWNLSYVCFVRQDCVETKHTTQKLFAAKQEAKRKDIERAFGILQARFHVLTSGCRLWDREAMALVIRTCVILHNLIIDHERKTGEDPSYIDGVEYTPNHPFTVMTRADDQTYEERMDMMQQMKMLLITIVSDKIS